MPEWWTKRSAPWSSGVMNPKPLSSLNHFTVPVAIWPLHCAFARPHARPERGKVPVLSACVTLDMFTTSDLVASVGDHGVIARTAVDVVALSVAGVNRVSAGPGLDVIAPWTRVDAVLPASGGDLVVALAALDAVV